MGKSTPLVTHFRVGDVGVPAEGGGGGGRRNSVTTHAIVERGIAGGREALPQEDEWEGEGRQAEKAQVRPTTETEASLGGFASFPSCFVLCLHEPSFFSTGLSSQAHEP